MSDATKGTPTVLRTAAGQFDMGFGGIGAKAEAGSFEEPGIRGVEAKAEVGTFVSASTPMPVGTISTVEVPAGALALNGEPPSVIIESVEANDTVDAVLIHSKELLTKLDEGELWLKGQHVLISHLVSDAYGRSGHNSEQRMQIPDFELGFKAFAAARVELLSDRPKREVLEFVVAELQKIRDQIASLLRHPLVASAIGGTIATVMANPLGEFLHALEHFIVQSFH